MSTTTYALHRPTAAPIARRTARPAAGQVRLTRRGRLVVFLLAIAVVLAVGVLLAAGSVATPQPGAAEPTTVVTVGTGDTLWEIAAERTESGDVQEMVSRIERLNALESSMLVAGQRLRVPVG